MTTRWKKTLDNAANLAGLTAGTYNLLARRPVPQKSGTLHIQGLHAAVEIITDTYGIPHIYAQSEDDLFFAQGYIHAQERLWQMEVNRRLCSGRLSEIVGDALLETDRFCRRLGMHRSAADEVTRLPASTLRILDAYARGVNIFIALNEGKLPVEFTLLRFQPEPWKPADTIQWAKMMGWSLGGNWETEITRAHLVAKLGVERASKLEAGYDANHPLIIPPGVEYQGINLGLREQYEQIQELSGFSMFGGSNNWVVDGTMTETGAPILCNDPHLGQAVPSIWYECHLVAGDLDVTGVSFPGTPGIVIGHNQHIAWGVTNAVSDVQDLYVEKFNPDNTDQYEYQGKWEDAEIIREEILVKGQDQPVIEKVRITRHGPILTAFQQPSAENEMAEVPLALRWTGLEHCNIISAVAKLDRATNWEEFRTALHDWDVPPQNFVYADQQGNIGYVMAGAIPIRNKGQALVPSPGWTGDYEWTGYIPFDELPQTYNPPQHFIATANNRVIDDTYPYYITNEWLNGYRAQRIRDLLTSKEKLTLADMAEIQGDQYSLPAVEILPHLFKLEGETQLEKAALEILKAWDYVLAPTSIAAAIYTKFFSKLEHIFLNTVLGDDDALKSSYMGVGSNILTPSNGYGSRSKPLLIRFLKEHDDSWFENSVIVNGPKSWDSAMKNAFKAALDELRDRLGSNILGWHYGTIHKMTYNHPLGAIKALERFFNRGPYAVGGDSDTVNMGATLASNPEVVITVPSFRQIVDLADLSRSRSIHAPGQSGLPASKHYDDFIPLWMKLEHHPMLFTRQAIEENAEGTLRMLPGR
jgi:penicillin amidase